ncbi:nuclear transport factor 2 family protein [Bradyrhizobium sp. 136]|nr:nuclear transport factor 2 family protein [Bradyrhizobium sp. 30]MCK1310828.1 nuclear transport factor 2 family protein [Bradyrhizobium sp. 45]MCK1315516.1 nuclear transport factor 2 family protein [Bradyrhizobium sp. 23]MCK1510126.1 nuclear transport factor 2 family protein [Bradyrhizobium sp. 18]MCK1609119.1 nuclear transport factor 2 family protein [Bradyrhizobium sp. 163]MCK1762689.1 nuclear transport factor 2 family protein [Bradyrhizobium sp. 136]
MLRTCFSCLFVTVFSLSAMADGDPRQKAEAVAAEDAASFNKQDGAGIAALFAAGGLQVNPAGPRSDIAEFYQGAFKAGFDHEEITVDQAWPLGSDMALAIGMHRLSGKNQSGAPMQTGGVWTATYVTEGGKLKIRLPSAMPKPPSSK